MHKVYWIIYYFHIHSVTPVLRDNLDDRKKEIMNPCKQVTNNQLNNYKMRFTHLEHSHPHPHPHPQLLSYSILPFQKVTLSIIPYHFTI